MSMRFNHAGIPYTTLSLTNLPAPENQKKQERLITAAPGLTVSDPCPVRVVNFSVTGIQIEGDEDLALVLAATSAAQVHGARAAAA